MIPATLFRQAYRVRYDEGNPDAFLTPTATLCYLQDIAGLDGARYKAKQGDEGFWIARRTVLQFNAPVPVGSALEISTFVLGFTKVTAQRGYEIYLVSSPISSSINPPEPVITARTLWVFIDLNGRPARLPIGVSEYWLPGGTRPPQQEESWPPLPAEKPFAANFTVRFSHLDIIGHMNNTAYVQMLEDAAWEIYASHGLRPGKDTPCPTPLSFDIEYLESAMLGDLLEVTTWLQLESPHSPTAAASGQKQYTLRQEVKRQDQGRIIARSRSRWSWALSPLG